MRVAYLAPELPALSATFVYNEILQLEAMGVDVVPFSVHKPGSTVGEARVACLVDNTVNLYSQAMHQVLLDNAVYLIEHPASYIKTLGLLFKDICSVGLFSRTALGLIYRFVFSANLAKKLLNSQCEHLHVHFAHIPTDIAMYASSLSGIPYSVTAHANDIYERGWLLVEKVDRSSFFATISEFNKNYLAGVGVNLSKVEVVRCGVEPTQFSRKESVVSDQVTRIGVIGRLVEKKGIDTLINAVAVLKDQGIKFELLIAGSGPLNASLRESSEKNNLTSNEICFLGAIPHADVAEFVKSLDMFVLPCRKDKQGDMDGIPVVLMEAMLSGVPVISTKISGIPELILNEETGLLVMPDDEQALAKAISSLIDDSALKNRMIINASAKVKEEFSLKSNAAKLKGLFNKIINGTKAL